MRMALLPQMMRSARLLECSALDLATPGLCGLNGLTIGMTNAGDAYSKMDGPCGGSF